MALQKVIIISLIDSADETSVVEDIVQRFPWETSSSVVVSNLPDVKVDHSTHVYSLKGIGTLFTLKF